MTHKSNAPFTYGLPHFATGFRNGLALSTDRLQQGTYNFRREEWHTYLVCDKCGGESVRVHPNRDVAILCHESYVLTIEKFLFRSCKDMPLLINHKDPVIRILAQWRLSEWI